MTTDLVAALLSLCIGVFLFSLALGVVGAVAVSVMMLFSKPREPWHGGKITTGPTGTGKPKEALPDNRPSWVQDLESLRHPKPKTYKDGADLLRSKMLRKKKSKKSQEWPDNWNFGG